MNESNIDPARHFSAYASLAAIGVHVRHLDLFGSIRQDVRVAQKTITHTPADKLYDAFISLLAGAHGLVEINTRLRSDSALQAAFGRTRCAEQSVVQETLDACTGENVSQMEHALDSIYRQHSQGSIFQADIESSHHTEYFEKLEATRIEHYQVLWLEQLGYTVTLTPAPAA